MQTVATRIVVDRERERMRFHVATYWDLDATLRRRHDRRLVPREARRRGRHAGRPTSTDFDEDGKLTARATAPRRGARDAAGPGAPASPTPSTCLVERKPYRRSPSPPFTTTTLQQEASRKLRLHRPAHDAAAQRLYEGGFITYMRTDSTTLSASAIESARATRCARMYGADYVPKEPRHYATKVKNAQEAHEAIRPAGDTFRLPDEVSREVGPDEVRSSTSWSGCAPSRRR